MYIQAIEHFKNYEHLTAKQRGTMDSKCQYHRKKTSIDT